MPKKRSAQQAVVGVFIPDGWDADFRVTSVFLACDGEREIAVRNLAERPELLGLVRRRARVTGTVAEDGAREIMDVETVRLLDEG